MNIDQELKNLKDTADTCFQNISVSDDLKEKILKKAELKQTVRFNPFKAIPAFALCLVMLYVAGIGIPSLLVPKKDPVIISRSAGTGDVKDDVTLRSDLTGGSLSLSDGQSAPVFRSIFSNKKGSYFPLVIVSGQTYRMLTTPGNVSNNQVGSSLGTVGEYTLEPSLSSSDIISNVVLEGVEVYSVKNMDGAMLVAEVDGKKRAFQRFCLDDQAIVGNETLGDTLKASGIKEMSLSDVGKITDEDTLSALYQTLLDNASYQSASVKKATQSLTIKLKNGLTVQLLVNGEQVMACGSWACPEFFEAFQNAI